MKKSLFIYIVGCIFILIQNSIAINGATFAIYVGPGAWADGVVAFENFLDWKGISHERVTPTDVNTYVLKDYYQAIFMPGGDAYYYKLYIDANGIQHIRDLVASGGGYFGTCAGAYFASDSIRWEGGKYDYPLDLFQGFSNGAIDSIAPWADYTMTPIHMNSNVAINQFSPGTMTSLYYGGQTFVPYPGVSVDTLFTWAAYYDSVGGIAFTYGSGRVILTGTHPEIDEDTDRDGTTFADSLNDVETDWNWLWTAMDWLLQKPLTTPQIWVNEFHYDDIGTDQNEMIEVVIPTLMNNPADITITLYDGATGGAYASYNLSTFTAGNQQNGLQLYYRSISGIQDGPDGIAIDYQGTVQQFISYEGAFTATDGPASGQTSQDIGISESGNDTEGLSLQMMGNGTAWPDFTWSGPYAQTPGQVNSDGNTDQALPVTLRTFSARFQGNKVELTWETAAELNNLGFIVERRADSEPSFTTIGSYLTHPSLQGAGSSTEGHQYAFRDSSIVPGTSYTYRLSSVDYSGQVHRLQTASVHVPAFNTSSNSIPEQFFLAPNYPNPFNATTVITFGIPASDGPLPVQLILWDTGGKQVKRILNQYLSPGMYTYSLSADQLGSGVYYLTLTAGSYSTTRKIVLLK